MLGNYNMPNISDKALIQWAGAVDKQTVKIKFPGGKLTLQSSYGSDIPKNIPAGREKFWSGMVTTTTTLLLSKDHRLSARREFAIPWG